MTRKYGNGGNPSIIRSMFLNLHNLKRRGLQLSKLSILLFKMLRLRNTVLDRVEKVPQAEKVGKREVVAKC